MGYFLPAAGQSTFYTTIDYVRYAATSDSTASVCYNGNYEGYGDVVIQETITDGERVYVVNEIQDYAFSGCWRMQTLVLPNTIKKIGYQAFRSCSELKRVDIPNSVVSIGSGAFSMCSKLEHVTLSNSLTTLSGSCFMSTAITSVEIPSSVETIETNVFYFCEKLRKVTIPNSVREIGYRAFYNCGLDSLYIPASVTSILGEAFTDNSNLSYINLCFINNTISTTTKFLPTCE